MELSRKERDLISRGYTEEEVLELERYTKEELDYATEVAFYRISKNATPSDSPLAFFVGGQPGCGKSSEVNRIKDTCNNIVEVNIDNYRSYHPNYLKIEECIKKHWKGRMTTEDDTPGNDIADFTHQFVSDITDNLIEKASQKTNDNKSYNMVVEWGMRNAEVPLRTMQDLKSKGYKNFVKFICVHKSISEEACSLRANVMLDGNHIIRNVPKSFHQLYVDTLANGINDLYEKGYKTGIISAMNLCLRDGTIVWKQTDKRNPGEVFNEYLIYKPILTARFKNSKALAEQNSNKEINVLDYKINELKKMKQELEEWNNSNKYTK